MSATKVMRKIGMPREFSKESVHLRPDTFFCVWISAGGKAIVEEAGVEAGLTAVVIALVLARKPMKGFIAPPKLFG